jgi:putative transposase
VVALPPAGNTTAVCNALGVSRASAYRRRDRFVRFWGGPRPKPRPVRAPSLVERHTVLELLHEPRFVDLAPAEIYATLLDEGFYHCSIPTMYRILDDNAKFANVATSCAIPSTASRNCWRKAPIRFGPGILRN